MGAYEIQSTPQPYMGGTQHVRQSKADYIENDLEHDQNLIDVVEIVEMIPHRSVLSNEKRCA